MLTMTTSLPVISDKIVETFREGLQAAKKAGIIEPTAMTLATHEADRVSARTVLLKQLDQRGFVFYTNLHSNKGRHLQQHPVAALTFLWLEIEQQVLVEGVVEQVSDNEADAYFSNRPRDSQIGAWASQQSKPLSSREEFEQAITDYQQQFLDQPVPRPAHWSGFRVKPTMVEFWYGREYRLHDRFRWSINQAYHWQCQRLYP